jgi:hypothetical protein
MPIMKAGWQIAISLILCALFIMPPSQLHAAGDSTPMLIEEQRAPVIINHFGRGKSGILDGYPQDANGTSSGEFTLYHWQQERGETTSLGYRWMSNGGHTYAVLLQLSSDRRIETLLLEDDEGCRRVAASEVGFMRDPVGYHPVLSIIDGRLSAGYGDLSAILSREIDWRDLAFSGTRFPRQWRQQAHLDGVTPESFGIVMRYEPTGGYRQGQKRGQGNTPHHWNLLAYKLEPLQRANASIDIPSVTDKLCGDLLNQPGEAFKQPAVQPKRDTQ